VRATSLIHCRFPQIDHDPTHSQLRAILIVLRVFADQIAAAFASYFLDDSQRRVDQHVGLARTRVKEAEGCFRMRPLPVGLA